MRVRCDIKHRHTHIQPHRGLLSGYNPTISYANLFECAEFYLQFISFGLFLSSSTTNSSSTLREILPCCQMNFPTIDWNFQSNLISFCFLFSLSFFLLFWSELRCYSWLSQPISKFNACYRTHVFDSFGLSLITKCFWMSRAQNGFLNQHFAVFSSVRRNEDILNFNIAITTYKKQYKFDPIRFKCEAMGITKCIGFLLPKFVWLCFTLNNKIVNHFIFFTIEGNSYDGQKMDVARNLNLYSKQFWCIARREPDTGMYCSLERTISIFKTYQIQCWNKITFIASYEWFSHCLHLTDTDIDDIVHYQRNKNLLYDGCQLEW